MASPVAPRIFALFLAACAFLAPAPLVADRVALVIGNGAYVHSSPLSNPPRDATDVAEALRACGFRLIGDKPLTELGNEALHVRLEEFHAAAAKASVALFFFAGHGLEVDGASYLLPVDADVKEKFQVKHRTLALEEVLASMGSGPDNLKIVILDCCRDNPLPRSWSRSGTGGLAAPSATPGGTVLLFATAPGKTADDGEGRNSPFSGVLKTALRTPGREIEQVFKEVGATVKRNTGGIQEPWMNSSFYGNFAFVPGSGPVPPPVTLAARARAATKDAPFVNSLGQEFIPLPGPGGILLCRTETRVRDFRAYATAAGYRQSGGAYVMKVKTKPEGGHTTSFELDATGSWENPGFSQSEDHPVTCVSWDEANAFCAWLTAQSAEKGLTYRLPTDAEWSLAVGSVGQYPWGNDLKDVNGNYWDQSLIQALPKANRPEITPGYDDGAERTARVGNYQENRFGFYDLGGNVWEWCSDWYRDALNEADVLKYWKDLGFDDGGGNKFRVLRGGSWDATAEIGLRSSYRGFGTPSYRFGGSGFRVVLEVGSGG